MTEDWLIPLRPFTEFDPLLIGGWYVLFFGLSMVASGVVGSIWEMTGGDSGEDPDFGLREVVAAGPFEEMIYRGIPAGIAVHVLELGPLWVFVILMAANGAWAGRHVRSVSTVAFTFVLGLFLTRFWVFGFDGLWWGAILMHSLHNFLVVGLGESGGSWEVDPRRRAKPE